MTKRAKSYLSLIILICVSCSGGNSNNAPAIAAPQNLNAVTVSSIQIDLAWDASTDVGKVAGYNIYRNGTKITSCSTTTYSDRTLSQNTNYCYTVAAYDTSGAESLKSNKVCAKTGIAPGWELTIDNISISESKSVLETSDNGFLVLGTASLVSAGTSSIYLVKISNDGNIMWEKMNMGLNTETGRGKSIIKTIDNNYLILGTFSSQADHGLYIAKIDPSGNLLWTKKFITVDYRVGNDIMQNTDAPLVSRRQNRYN